MDDKKSFADIQNEIAAAAQAITIGATYRHYKSPDMTYKPVLLATREADNQLYVVYQAQYGPGLYFSRPVEEWLDKVEWDGQTVQRFAKI